MPYAIQRVAILASMIFSAAACSGPAASADAGTDAGTDAGIELPDTGPPPGHDAGPADAGDGTCADLSALLFGTPPLPPACLPRCTADTRDAVTACGDDSACAEAAMNADDTPPTSARTRYGIQMVSCRASRSSYGCVTWQKYSCYEEYCRTEYYAYADCFDNTTGSCDTELGALQACMDADADATACLTERVRACFP